MATPSRQRVIQSWSNGILISAVARFVEAYPESLLLLPNRMAYEGMAHHGASVVGVHAMTVVELAAELARPAMAARGLGPLSRLGREAVAARIIHLAYSGRELKYFEPVARSPGFSRALAVTIADLRMAQVPPADLAGRSASADDLARLLQRYEHELQQRQLVDLAGILNLATEGARDSPNRLLGLPVALLDPALDTPAHRQLVRAITARASHVLAAAPGTDSYAEQILEVDAENLDQGPAGTSLEHLRRFLFLPSAPEPAPRRAPDDGRFQLFSAPGEGLEAVEIARRILRLARAGRRFDEIAILLRNPDRYQPMVEEALRRAKVPAYFSRGTARPEPAGRAFLALLACAAERLSASRFAEYLSLGQVPEPASRVTPAEWVGADPGADDELLSDGLRADTAGPEEAANGLSRSLNGWEKLLVDAAVISGDRWKRRLAGLRAELELQKGLLEQTEPDRAASITRRLESLGELEHFALPLIETLAVLPVAASWSEWEQHLGNLARKALRDPDPVLAVLAEFEPMGDVGPASLEEVFEVLSERLRFLRRDPPRRHWGRVFVGPVEEARGCEFGVVFLPGLSEGLFPRRALEDPLLLDDFRREMNAQLPLRAGRAEEERRRLHVAAGAARDLFVASYSRMDVAEARPRVPSFYALELPRAIQGSLPALKDFERLAREAAPARLNRPAPLEAGEAIDDAEYDVVALEGAGEKVQAGTPGGARYLVEANAHLARSLRARWTRWKTTWREADGLITADRAALDVLAEHRLTARPWSPSALERFAVCPYRFALAGIFGLRPRDEAAPLEQLDPLTRGALFHAVQFALLRDLQDGGLLPVTPERLEQVLELADAALTRVAGEYEEQLAPAIPRVWRSAIEDLRTDLRGWLQHTAQNDQEWMPAHFELGFGLAGAGLKLSGGRDPASKADPVALDEGVQLRGSIDLVERNLTRNVLRITDHKTGKPLERPPAFVGGGKTLQPLLYALAAAGLTGQPVESGRLFYSTQRGGYQQMAVLVNDRARAFLRRFLGDVDGSIGGGFLPPAPEKDACEYCDYRAACGPYEQQRSGRKDRRDERMEALIEIRGMA